MDNGSVYTKNLINFLSEKKTEFISKKFDEVNLSDIQQFESFILSGRRKNDRRINAINSKIIKHAVSEKKSLLGICYGAEILAITLGGTILHSLASSKSCKYEIVKHNNLNIFGTQFHPEMSDDGKSIIQTFLSI